MTDPNDLTGVWYGRYRSDADDQDNGFIALLEDRSGAVSGSISEPDEARSAIRRASVSGQRGGSAVRFVKQYDGSGGWNHSVVYSGNADADGTQIAGTWIVDRISGTFTMSREKFDAEALEDRAETELTVR